jgi:DNA-binding LacI/PurR family transcriptional regulator
MTPSNATLADVAARVGVSRTTVSNAYNRPNQLSPALREKVLAAAAELGYTGPNPMASGLRRGTTNTIGLVFDSPLTYAFTDPAAVLFLSGVAAGCEDRGSALALVPRLAGGEAELVRSALVDGYVFFCTHEADPRLEAAQARGLPIVLVDYDPRDGAATVGIDDREGARRVAQHLVDLGHRRFGIVVPYKEPDPEGERRRYHVRDDRIAGWRDALVSAGVDWDAVPVETAEHSRPDTGTRAAAALLDRRDRPTAIIALSDVLAFRALDAAAERGIDVPDELSVVGFDDVPDAAAARLTTIRQPHAEKGAAAVRLLAEGAPPENLTLPIGLVVRASTAPAR